MEKRTYTITEFAAIFGKERTWAYRQLYAGKVSAITEFGRLQIPEKEVERLLESAGIYNGKEKPKRAKTPQEKLSLEQKSIWLRFVEQRRKGEPGAIQGSAKASGREKAGKDVRAKIASRWAKPRRLPKRKP